MIYRLFTNFGSNLIATMDLGMSMYTYLIFNSRNEFFDLENIHIDTRIIFLCAILREIGLHECFGSHLGGHLGFAECPRVPHGHQSDL